jgi:hypothetical protein
MKKSLLEAASVIRSKNSGPFELTLDIIFKDAQAYRKICEEQQITPQMAADLYHVPLSEILNFVWYAPANSLKITLKRPIDSGSIGERDTYGAQQYAPLLALTVDI